MNAAQGSKLKLDVQFGYHFIFSHAPSALFFGLAHGASVSTNTQQEQVLRAVAHADNHAVSRPTTCKVVACLVNSAGAIFPSICTCDKYHHSKQLHPTHHQILRGSCRAGELCMDRWSERSFMRQSLQFYHCSKQLRILLPSAPHHTPTLRFYCAIGLMRGIAAGPETQQLRCAADTWRFARQSESTTHSDHD